MSAISQPSDTFFVLLSRKDLLASEIGGKAVGSLDVFWLTGEKVCIPYSYISKHARREQS